MYRESSSVTNSTLGFMPKTSKRSSSIFSDSLAGSVPLLEVCLVGASGYRNVLLMIGLLTFNGKE
jgi:hypothetical protein